LARQGDRAAPQHQRGTRVVAGVTDIPRRSPRLRATRDHSTIRGDSASHGISLAGHAVAAADETRHFKLIGTTGTGKSTAIREILDVALRRGDRAVIADPDGGYLNRYFDARRGDVILNPFDTRARKWDVFGEIQSAYDVEHLARSLIPDSGGSDRSWNNYARTYFVAVTRQAHDAGVTDIGELYRLLVAADSHELRTLVQGTAAQPFLEEHNSRMFDSIRSITSSAVGALEYLARQQTDLFSVRQWVARGNAERGGGVLFMPYQAGQIAALRSTISAWMRLGIFAAMDQPEGDQRLWFVVDELDALGPIDGLKDALARLRKFGGRCVLGFQSIGQVSTTYGTGEAQTIVENCGNTLILRCSSSQHGGTASFASKLIGQREVIRTTLSHSKRFAAWFGSTTRSEHLGIEPAVLDAEIEQLADREGYLKLTSAPQWQRVRLELTPAVGSIEKPSAKSPSPSPSTMISLPQLSAMSLAGAEARETWRQQRATARGAAPAMSPLARSSTVNANANAAANATSKPAAKLAASPQAPGVPHGR
jgi:type IV secretory pathway TraG/TraD family ATPase VirD4